MLFNGRTLIFTFSRTQVRIAEIERLQSLFKTSMVTSNNYNTNNITLLLSCRQMKCKPSGVLIATGQMKRGVDGQAENNACRRGSGGCPEA